MTPRDLRPPRWPIAALALALVGGLLWWLRGREPVLEAAPGEVGPVEPRAPHGSPARPDPTVELRLARHASIAGTITDLRGRPITGAQVCARASSTRLATGDLRRAVCAHSEHNGHYHIDSLFPVRHTVVASAPGHIPATYHHGEGASRRAHVELRATEDATGIDLQLEGGGVEIHGTVKDLSGGPVEGAQVVAGEAAITSSDAEGRFSTWVRPGPVWVSAQADGYASGFDGGPAPGRVFEVFLTPEAVLIGKVVRASDGSPVEGARVSSTALDARDQAFTDANGVFRIDGLHPGLYKPRAESDDALGQAAEQTILGLGETSAPIVVTVHPAFFVEGTVVIAGGGDGCDEGEVSLIDAAAQRGNHATTEGDGVFRLRGVLPGDHQVTVRCPGFISEERYPHVIVRDRSVAGLRWQVSRGQSIRGTVVDASGEPVPRFSVSATPKLDPNQPRAQRTNNNDGESDERGAFELAGLLPGDYTLIVWTWSAPRARPTKPLELTLPKGQDLDGVKIELPATGEVKGSVRDAKGRPVARVQVALTNNMEHQTTSAADDGSFHFPHVATGEHRVFAVHGQNDRLRAPGTGDDDVQGERVEVRAGGVADVALLVESRGIEIRGVVRDADGAAVADAFVEATRESTSAAGAAGSAARTGRWGSYLETPRLTDHDGRFTITGLADSKHTIRAHRKGGGEAIAEHVEPGGDLVLTIAATGRMSGTVTMPGGAALEEFIITLVDETTGFNRTDRFLRTGGLWSLPELPAGKYTLRVSAGAGSAELEASMTAGQDTSGVRVELTPRVTVRGMVVDLDGKPLTGMMVIIDGAGGWAGGDENKRNVTDAAGRYELTHVPAGTVVVRVYPPNAGAGAYQGATLPAAIAASGDTVELPPIRVPKRRTERGDVAGDFGHSLKQPEPGDDLLRRQLVVAVVRPGSPAAQAGLEPDDEIIAIDGHDVSGPNTYLYGALTDVPVGTTVQFGLASGANLAITAATPP